jgi:hypothetical protein
MRKAGRLDQLPGIAAESLLKQNNVGTPFREKLPDDRVSPGLVLSPHHSLRQPLDVVTHHLNPAARWTANRSGTDFKRKDREEEQTKLHRNHSVAESENGLAHFRQVIANGANRLESLEAAGVEGFYIRHADVQSMFCQSSLNQ